MSNKKGSNNNIDLIAEFFINLLIKLIGFLSLKTCRKIGAICGRILLAFDKRHKVIAMNNLKLAFKDQKNPDEIKKICRKHFESLGMIIFEVAWSLRLKKHELFKYVKTEGRVNIKKAYEKKRGVLVLTGHFGNFELLTVAAAILNYHASIVYRPLDYMPMEKFIINLRTRFGGKLISTKDKPFKKIIEALFRAEMVGLLMDQSVDWYQGVFVDFFGEMTCTNKGMALLALNTEVPVVPVFMIREDYGFKAIWLPELILKKTGDERKDIEINTQQYNNIIETLVREYPEQWFWVHNRWKTSPYSKWPDNNDSC